ncbi:RagB/SusD family nutrient uptake outer membrane protein [Dyadobacter sp. CY345]|uniref:RagB/SusD family nutrient uptake outer membrane protein n=1 Tax=Dyadobacter sp. CY345 TaxID=2909335 RepID=UPI001F42E369|nr:RagB/SusD family nutrient uptake outer membrane protein [Dyadobacter sp. CY345]MCF2447645.1 RagB/SusD family nutrient uptake outer membrane protein [Dyadobacter sp. CY345]
MKKKILSSHLLLTGLLFFASCSDFLEYQPQGTLSTDNVSTPENAEALVTAAYAGIGNDEMIGPMTSMWVYGSVRSDDAYKGGGGVADVADVNFYEQHNLTQAQQGDGFMHPYTWENFYKAISRANFAIKTISTFSEEQFPLKQIRLGELRFLRGHSHFMMKMLFKKIPFITENLSSDDILKTSNEEFTNDQLWDKIGEDFQFAMDNLPETQAQVGRASKLSAAAYLAKLRLYQAYEQDDLHKVTNINKTRLQQVIDLTQMVISSGKYSLQPDFAENFLDGFDNGPESVFAIQYSINDGTSLGRISTVTGLNYPHGAPQYGCCGFHQPTQNLANAFGTDANGLPKFDTFNSTEIDFKTATVDPRVDHTIGIDGHPYKYNAALPFSNSWVRDPGVYGYFQSMKEQQLADCGCYKKEGPFIGTSKNIDIIRYADVLLFQAEAYIELGQQAAAMPLINQVRERAAKSTNRTKLANGNNPSNYLIKPYTAGNWTQDFARKALQWERRLEFAMESPRFFDLVRWGIAEPTLNAYIAKEKTRRSHLNGAKFTAGRDEYLPIPQKEINFTKGLYKQNPGF